MRASPVVTLTTDFGAGSPYVAAMKAALWAVSPRARVIDLSHQIPGQDLRFAAAFLEGALSTFAAGPIHVVVVDPGVGSDRAVLYVEVGHRRLLVPDNGVWTLLERGGTPRVIRLSNPCFWRQPVSATFHGRDIFAPVAAWLSLGLRPDTLGPPVSDWVRLKFPDPTARPDEISGEVVFVDPFGNLITNISREHLSALGDAPLFVSAGPHERIRLVRTYADAPPGEVIALISSGDRLEIAVNQGSAAARLQAGLGTFVRIRTDR